MNCSLLVVSPHFKFFQKDQVKALSDKFGKVNVLVPQPYSTKIVFRIPYLRDRLLFLRNATDSCSTIRNGNNTIDVSCPKFFTLPIECMRKRNPLLSARSTIKMVRQEGIKFDLMHAHCIDYGFVCAKLKDECNKPLVVTCHGSDVYDFPFRNSYNHAIASYTIERTDHFIAICKSDAQKLMLLGLSPNRFSIIPNGFDDTFFKPASQQLERKKLGLSPAGTIILSIGALHPIKGQMDLIDAIHEISKVRNDILTVIVGAGPSEAKLKARINELGLNQKVLLMGWVPHHSISSWINASDIFVLPSLNEGFPTVIPEVLACGKPVVATRVGGIPDVISNPDVGVLANPSDSQSLAHAILWLLDRGWDSQKILKYAQQYSLRNIVRQILEVYQHVL